jgi:ArsR family transcriptional regulator, virulence genes transcriptional regulator
MCRALGDATRLRIIYALAHGELSVSELCLQFGVPQPTVSRHLRVLREHALVTATRDAQFVRYRLRDPHVLKVLDGLRRFLVRSEDDPFRL